MLFLNSNIRYLVLFGPANASDLVELCLFSFYSDSKKVLESRKWIHFTQLKFLKIFSKEESIYFMALESYWRTIGVSRADHSNIAQKQWRFSSRQSVPYDLGKVIST